MAQKAIKQTRRGFFSLPAELRNTIYEYVLADVQDNLCIDLIRGPNNNVYKGIRAEDTNTQDSDTQQKTYLTSDDASPLSLLLTCRKINKEASAMAYSKMSITFDFVDGDLTRFSQLWSTRGTDTKDTKETRSDYARRARDAKQRIKTVLKTFARTFRASNRSHITHIRIHRWSQIMNLRDLNSSGFGSQEFNRRCTKKCDLAGVEHRGLIHNSFHHIRRITFQEPGPTSYYYGLVTAKESWFSRYVGSPEEVEELLKTFPSLEEVMVRRTCHEQTSYVRDGRVYSAYGLLIGGRPE